MAQHDYIISNQTFPNTRADINNLASAIATNNSGTSAPTTQYAGQFWIDTTTTTWTLYIHDGTDDIQFATIDTSANTVNFTDSALDVVTDTTPQLGGNLDLNSNDITGTGNINITGNLNADIVNVYNASQQGRLNVSNNGAEQLEVFPGDVSNKVTLQAFNRSTVASNSFRYIALTHEFSTGGSERMRIDSSGNFLFAKTSTSSSVAGIRFAGDAPGYAEFTRDGGNPLYLNRETSIGNIISFAKDDASIGFIGNNNASSGLEIVGGSAGLAFVSSLVVPVNGSGNYVDNTLDLGTLSYRFDDIFATNGTIQTSDQNEKQSIQSLTASEIAVAQRISKLFKTFKFNSAVEQKGDNARTHTGIIAQDVQQAFTDEGLDASNYALFISSTWWEKEISVDAVAPQEAVYETQTDEEGNEIQVLVQEAVEGKDAYTYIDTKEEATEGYTERTRLGIRYPELLSFVSSAFEQRLTNIETRLTALET